MLLGKKTLAFSSAKYWSNNMLRMSLYASTCTVQYTFKGLNCSIRLWGCAYWDRVSLEPLAWPPYRKWTSYGWRGCRSTSSSARSGAAPGPRRGAPTKRRGSSRTTAWGPPEGGSPLAEGAAADEAPPLRQVGGPWNEAANRGQTCTQSGLLKMYQSWDRHGKVKG